MSERLPLVMLTVGLTTLGCEDPDAPARGSLSVAVDAKVFQELVTSDGWAMRLDGVYTSVRGLQLGNFSSASAQSFDLSAVPQTLGEARLAVGRYSAAQFTVERLQVVGSAEKDGVVKRFDWSLEDALRHEACANETVVTASGTAELRLSVDPAQLFRASLADRHRLLFQPIAEADRNEDGEVEGDELWEQDVGSYEADVRRSVATVWELIEALSAQAVLVDGHASCKVTRE